MEPRKQAIIGALRAFIRQRSGLEFGNYGDVKAFRAEQRAITRDRHRAETLLAAVASNDSITADMLLEAARGAYSGRLAITPHCRECDTHGAHSGETCNACVLPSVPWTRVTVDYCAGQYFPTEYRKAVCAVLASALWYYVREHCMPAPTYKQHGSATDLPMCTEARYDGKSAGDWLRAYFRREFGRGIADRYFH